MTLKIMRSIVLLAAMAGSAYAAVLLTPKVVTPHSQEAKVGLEGMIPKSFAGWHLIEDQAQGVVSADLQAQLDRYYSEVLSRTYVNNQGDRIMLSLAYGADQSRALQVHKPEICYAAQGFKISNKHDVDVHLSSGSVPATRLEANMGGRHEPITYWIRFGDEIVRNWYEQNKARIVAGLQGHIPDGLLVRVSNINANADEAYKVQDQFLKDLLNSVGPQGRHMLLGVVAARP